MYQHSTKNLKHEVEYVNGNGETVTALVRELDAAKALETLMEDDGFDDEENDSVFVFRKSDAGTRPIAKFSGSTAQEDAEKFRELMNENYATLGFYEAVIA